MKMLFDLRDFWKMTSNFQKRTMLVYLKTCAPLLLIQSCLFGIHLPTWRTKHVSQLKLSAALSLNKFSLVIYIQFSQYKVILKSIMKKNYIFLFPLWRRLFTMQILTIQYYNNCYTKTPHLHLRYIRYFTVITSITNTTSFHTLVHSTSAHLYIFYLHLSESNLSAALSTNKSP